MRFRGMLGLMVLVCSVSFFYFVTLFFAGQAPVLFQMPEPIDEATPKDAHSRTGFDGNEYELVFSDEFEVEGRTFWPGKFCFLLFHSFFLRFLCFFFSFFAVHTRTTVPSHDDVMTTFCAALVVSFHARTRSRHSVFLGYEEASSVGIAAAVGRFSVPCFYMLSRFPSFRFVSFRFVSFSSFFVPRRLE